MLKSLAYDKLSGHMYTNESAKQYDIQSQDIIICHLVTSPFKSMYLQIFCKKYCCKTIEATIMKKISKGKQIDLRY